MRKVSTTLRLVVGVAVTSMVLAACGSSSNSGDEGSSGSENTSSSSQSASETGESTPSSSEDSGSGSASGSSTAESGSSDTGSASESGSSDTGESSADSPEMTGDKSAVSVGLAYDVGGRGDQSFNDSAARGLDKAKAEGVPVAGESEAAMDEPDSAKADRLNQLISDGANTIIAVGFAYAGPLGKVAPNHPDVHFAIVDDNSLCSGDNPLPNVDCMNFAAEQSSFLVGVAAALKTKTDHVGFIGGVDVPLIQTFQAGYDAGVQAVNKDIEIDDKYISEPPDMSGFNDPKSGQTIAKGMYDDGADIVYSAAGGSGAGVFKAAKEAGTLGIGVDSDQYKSPSLQNVKDVIMTSAIKNVDVAVYDFIVSAVNGKPLTGTQIYNLENGGVGVAYSGGKIDDIKSQIEDYKQKIISGDIKVPTTLS